MNRAAANTAQAELFDVPRLTDGERRAWRRPPRLSVSQWAEKNYTITDGQFTGPWRNEITPYLVEIMDTWQRPEVRSVSIMAPPQSGKTKVMHICWAYGAAVLSSNSLWVLPDQDSAEETMEELAKAVQDSDSLRALVTGRPRDLSHKRLKLMGATTRSGWSTSPKRLARVSVEHLFCDEKGKWSGYDPNNPEARPAKLARARLTAYPYTRKEMTCSSPTIPGDEISRDVFNAQELRVYMARCPDCGKLQIAKVAQLSWDASAETDPDMIESQNLAWYQCEHCESLWSQAKMRLASRTGDFGVFTWDPETSWFIPADPKSAPSSIGFQYGGFYSSFISLGRIAAQAIRAGYRMDPDTGGQQRPTDATRDLDEEHDLYNTLLSLPYKNEEAAREETRILIHCDESRPRGQAPDWCTHLFLTADVRKLGIDYTVRAWRAGPLGRSSLVWAGFVESFEAFEALFRDMSFTDPGGNAVPIHFGLVDSGYKKDETYLLCWNNPPLRPAKGQGEDGRRRPSWAMGFKAAKIETYPDMPLYHMDANYYKNRLHQKIMMEPGQPGSWELHADTRPDGTPGQLADYARQLCGERRDERNLWVTVGGGRHDLLDCEYMQIACADICALNKINPEPAAPRPRQDQEPKNIRRRPSWRKSPRRS